MHRWLMIWTEVHLRWPRIYPWYMQKIESGENICYMDDNASNHMMRTKNFIELDEKIVRKIRFCVNVNGKCIMWRFQV